MLHKFDIIGFGKRYKSLVWYPLVCDVNNIKPTLWLGEEFMMQLINSDFLFLLVLFVFSGGGVFKNSLPLTVSL